MRGAEKRSWKLAFWATAALALAAPASAAHSPDGFPLPRTTFGSIGLIEMPSARMAPDGELSLSASLLKNTQRYDFGVQALPWLNLSFRYSGIGRFRTGGRTYYDHSFGARLRLFQESQYTPAISIGMRDVMGNGVYAGEYIVATKRIFDDFDATIGMGWGRLGSTGAIDNPLRHIAGSFGTRAPVNMAARADFGQLFHGPKAGLFGGLVWRTPIRHLSLIAEYSSDRYLGETASGSFRPRTQLNFGANYRLFDTVQLGLSWLYGRSVGVTLSIDADPTAPIYHQTNAPAPFPAVARTEKQRMNALVAMLQQSRHSADQVLMAQYRPRQLDGLATGIDGFANALTGRASNVTNVSMRGTTLYLSVNSSTWLTRACRAFAGLTRNALHDVSFVVVTAPDGARQRCLVTQPAVWRSDDALDKTAIGTRDDSEIVHQRMAQDLADEAESKVRRDAKKQSVSIAAIAIRKTAATIYFVNWRYGTDSEAASRLVRVLMKDAPADVEQFHLISLVNGIPAQQYDILRAPMERDLAQRDGNAIMGRAIHAHLPALHSPVLDRGRDGTYPRFHWSILPKIRADFFTPDRSARFAVLGATRGEIDVLPGLSLSAQIEADIWNNFDKLPAATGTLPHVRSDLGEYYRHGKYGIESLQAAYRFRLRPDLYGIVKAGYLESMYGGAGGELLWRPEGSRLALGLDLYEVWQRNFNRLFGFRPYHVTTGHVSLYYASPWYGLNLKLMAGRYLAGDNGLTFQISRRFSTGVEVAAFATFTNVPYSTYGDGSFDNGILITIPLDWALPITTQSQADIALRPLTRDGGQRLEGDTSLYDETRSAASADILDFEGEIASR